LPVKKAGEWIYVHDNVISTKPFCYSFTILTSTEALSCCITVKDSFMQILLHLSF